MLPRRLRLPRRAFSSRGTRHSSPHFLVSMHLATLGEGGCAAIVSKKVARLSVTRHLLKRRILSVVRPWCKSQVALVVHARAGAATLPFSTLKAELEVLLSKLFATL